jgi:7-carboxy-7-deazaguanine synthase
MYIKVNEIFSSINGEGDKVGQFATFIRLQGCNLNCWGGCDTPYALCQSDGKLMTEKGIVEECKRLGNTNITLTGGEPLLQDIKTLLTDLILAGFVVSIETNGSQSIAKVPYDVQIIMDYKCISTGESTKMLMHNFKHLANGDIVKFVVMNEEDILQAKDIIEYIKKEQRPLIELKFYFSPVYGKIKPDYLIELLKKHNLTDTNMVFQLQLHKYIYPIDMRGV